MKRMTHGLVAVALAGAISLAPVSGAVSQPFTETVYAHGHHGGSGCYGGGHHGGGYGYNGGGAGVCYYYCDGYAAHLHNNGVCPYAYSAPAASKQTVSKATVKKVQRKLNKLGYKCGKVNGIMGAKTKKAVKRYKMHHGLRVDSTIKKPLLRKLGLLKKR